MDTESVLMDARWEQEYEGTGEEVRGLRSTSRQLQNSHGDVKYSIGNGVAKELTCMTDDMNNGVGLPEGVVLWGVGQRRENQDNYNSIINKI